MSSGTNIAQTTRQRLRRWWPWLVLSAILHLPLTPLGPLFGLLSLLVRMEANVPDEPVEEFTGIPVELLAEQAPAPEAAPPVPAPAANENAVVIAPPKPKSPKKPKVVPVDAGLPDASLDAGSDAGVADASLAADAGLDAGVPPPDAGVASPDDAGLGDAGTKRPDPFAIAGELGKFQKGNVNVRIHLFVEPLKAHPAGAVIADLLSREPQWEQFLGPSGIDPLQAFTKIVIMGPQLVDSSQVGIFLEYQGEPAAMRKAVDALVQRTEGARWETKNKKPVARVHAAGGDRVIILYPNHGIAIVPPKPAEQLVTLSRFPTLVSPTNENEILQLMLKTPYRVRAFKRAGIDVPQSISMARVFVSGNRNGGASLRLELDDESPEAAGSHGPELERDLSRLTMGIVGIRFSVEGSTIIGEANVSPLIVGQILRDVKKRFLPKPAER